MPDSQATLFDRLGGRSQLLELLTYFYADVRQHAEIAPIFATYVKNWPAHIEMIADFWSGVTGGPVRFYGAQPFKHLPRELEECHFQAWLGLWSCHCTARLAPAEAAEMIAAAETLAERLRQIVGVPSGAQLATVP